MTEPIIFLHIPKTGGTTLRHLLTRRWQDSDLVEVYPPVSEQQIEQLRRGAFQRSRMIFGHLRFGVHRPFGLEPVYAAMLRDPVDRVASYFRHHLYNPRSAHHGRLRSGMTLEAFVEQRLTLETNNHMTRILSGYRPAGYVDDEALVDTALDNIQRHFLFVGLTEAFDESVQRLSAILGEPMEPKSAPRLNRSRGNAQATLAADAVACIERHNRLDRLLYRAVADRFAATRPKDQRLENTTLPP